MNITELALMKGQKVEAPYYLAECTECGKMYSSSKLIESRNYFDGDADCYCPHCNAEDADIADLGSGEQPAAMAWNYQQARIDTLVEALEKAQQRIGKLEKKITDHKRMNQEMAKAMLTPNDSDVAGMEIAALRQRIAELESRTVTVKLPEPPGPMSVGARTVYFGIVADVVSAFQYGITTAGIKVEVE